MQKLPAAEKRHDVLLTSLRHLRLDVQPSCGIAAYSGLRFANFTTLPHFSVSAAISLPKSPGEPPRVVTPMPLRRPLNLGSARAALISLLSLSTISAGVFLGAPRPHTALASYPGTNLLILGRSGNTSERDVVVTPSARNVPARTCAIDALVVWKVTCTWPAIKSVKAGGEPRYGTCSKLTPAIILNSSPVTWLGDPTPAEAMLILPGLAFA